MKIAVIGAGIFGCSIALELDKHGHQVMLFEKESDILSKATKNNHNRLHYGYHYPRSTETAKQSLDGLLSFFSYYGGCVSYGFDNYYAVSKENSNTSVSKFKDFCRQVGIGFKTQYPDTKFMNREIIEECFLVEEPIYDWKLLKSIVNHKLYNSNVSLLLDTDFTQRYPSFDFVIDCTYSSIEKICNHIGVESKMNYKRQDVIIPIFQYKHKKIGLTVLDGKFCSIMPKGNEVGKFLLYHAKYSIIEEVLSGEIKGGTNIQEGINNIFADAINYFPFLSGAEQQGYYRSDRIIPVNNNDERLSEIITYKENDKFITIFSGKVTTAVRVAKQVVHGVETGDFNSNILV